MVTLTRSTSIPLPKRHEEIADPFIARAKTLGIEVNALAITKPSRVFPWIARNHEFLKVSWRKRKSVSILGLFTISWMKAGSGIFRRHPVYKVLMPLQAERIAEKLGALPEVEDTAVLEDRVIDPILAFKVNGKWYEAFRWLELPHILPDDCPLIAADVERNVSEIGKTPVQ